MRDLYWEHKANELEERCYETRRQIGKMVVEAYCLKQDAEFQRKLKLLFMTVCIIQAASILYVCLS